MQVSPFENCGAVVSDLQLATMTDTELTELRSVFTKHGLLFFRDQDLPPQGLRSWVQTHWQVVISRY